MQLQIKYPFANAAHPELAENQEGVDAGQCIPAQWTLQAQMKVSKHDKLGTSGEQLQACHNLQSKDLQVHGNRSSCSSC